jgi:flagellar protein FlgJ
MDTAIAGIYNDFSGLNSLMQQARAEPNKAAHEVAQQFESIFVSMMMKAMRSATPKDGLFGSDQMEAYQDMFDKQLALDLSTSGGLGLASIIERQIIASSPRTSDSNEM